MWLLLILKRKTVLECRCSFSVSLILSALLTSVRASCSQKEMKTGAFWLAAGLLTGGGVDEDDGLGEDDAVGTAGVRGACVDMERKIKLDQIAYSLNNL